MMDRDQELTDTNILISPGKREPAPVQPVPVFQPTMPSPSPIYVPAPQTPIYAPNAPVTTRTYTPSAPVTTYAPTYTPAPAPTPIYVPEPRKTVTTSNVHQVTTTKHKLKPATTKSKTTINWGGVIKGVAVVGAVVLVGVGLYYGGTALTSWVLSNPTISAIGAGIVSVATPVVSAIGTGLSAAATWISGILPQILPAIGNFFSSIPGWLGLGGATLAPAHAATAATAIGVTAAGAGVVYGATHWLPSLDHTNLLHHTTTVTPATDHITATSTVTADPVTTQVGRSDNHDLSDDALRMQATPQPVHHDHSTHTAAELSHHSLHFAGHKVHAAHYAAAHQDHNNDVSADVSGDSVSAPDVDIDEADLAKFAKGQQPRGWRSHLFRRATDRQAIAPRNSSFAAALDEDRMKLAALTDQQRN